MLKKHSEPSTMMTYNVEEDTGLHPFNFYPVIGSSKDYAVQVDLPFVSILHYIAYYALRRPKDSKFQNDHDWVNSFKTVESLSAAVKHASIGNTNLHDFGDYAMHIAHTTFSSILHKCKGLYACGVRDSTICTMELREDLYIDNPNWRDVCTACVDLMQSMVRVSLSVLEYSSPLYPEGVTTSTS